MPLYDLREYSDNYSKTSKNLWQYYRDKLCVNDDDNIVDCNAANVNDSFNFKVKITGQTYKKIACKMLKLLYH